MFSNASFILLLLLLLLNHIQTQSPNSIKEICLLTTILFYSNFILTLMFYFIVLKIHERRYLSFCDIFIFKN